VSGLLAGVAKVNITPYLGAFLAGFAIRDHGCEGVHDELFAKALVLQAGETTVGIVACDLIGLGLDSVATIRQRVEAATGIPPGHIMVACSHTHSGPTMGILRHPGLDAELVHVTEKKIAGALIAACRSLVEASLGVGKGRARIGVNRRERVQDGTTKLGTNVKGPIDPDVGVLRVDDAQGRPLALAVVYACHPVVLDGQNYLVSADYPGPMAALLEGVHPSAACLFLGAAGGDINPVRVGGTFDHTRRLGRFLGAEALRVAEALQTKADVQLAARQTTVEALLADLPPASDAREIIGQRTRQLDEQLARGEISRERYDADWDLGWGRDVLAEYGKPDRIRTRPLELQALRLGDALVIGTPGETFVEIALAIKAASPMPNTFVLGHANGTLGYIPTAAAFEEGGYEVETAHRFYYGVYAFTPEVEQAVTEAGIALAKQLAAAT